MMIDGFTADSDVTKEVDSFFNNDSPLSRKISDTDLTFFGSIDTEIVAQRLVAAANDINVSGDDIELASHSSKPTVCRALSPPISLLTEISSSGIPSIKLPSLDEFSSSSSSSTSIKKEDNERESSENGEKTKNASNKKRRVMSKSPTSVAANIKRSAGEKYDCALSKRNGGLGLTLASVDGQVHITGVAPHSPASESDVRLGDVLLNVDGISVRHLHFAAIIGKLKAAPRRVVLTLQHSSKETIEEESGENDEDDRVDENGQDYQMEMDETDVDDVATEAPVLPIPTKMTLSAMERSQLETEIESLKHQISSYIRSCNIDTCNIQECLRKLDSLFLQQEMESDTLIDFGDDSMDITMQLQKKLVKSLSKIRKLRMEESRRSALALAEDAKKKKFVLGEMDRLKRLLVYEMKDKLGQETTPDHVKISLEAIRKEVFQLLFSVDIEQEDDCTKHYLKYDNARQIFGWNCSHVFREKDAHRVIQLEFPMLISYDSRSNVLSLSTSINSKEIV